MSTRAYAARRAAPRRRTARRRRSGVNWDRLGRVALVLVLFAVLVSYMNPVMNFVHSWRDSRAGKEKLVQLQQKNALLKRQTDQLRNDPTVLVREARKQGMVQPGERPYHIDGLPH